MAGHIVGDLFVLLVLVIVANAQDYCSICSDHTMCQFPVVGPKCAPRIRGGTNSQDQAAILKSHNTFRQKVAQGQETRGTPGPQKSASNMRALTWDDELATVAQRWADQCNFGHDPCRKVSRFAVGQNVAITMGSPSKDWNQAVSMWYNEVKDYDSRKINPFSFSAKTGHYTQLVWAETSKVGCGFTEFQQPGKSWIQRLYVCNYGMSGNWLNAAMYKVGKSCSQCPSGTVCGRSGYAGLCG